MLLDGRMIRKANDNHDPIRIIFSIEIFFGLVISTSYFIYRFNKRCSTTCISLSRKARLTGTPLRR